MKAPQCPNPESIVRVSHGQGTLEEAQIVEAHALVCADCREEMAALKQLGPAAAWSGVRGADAEMPEALWRGVATARATARFRVRIGSALREAGGEIFDAAAALAAVARDLWLAGASGAVQLKPLAASPVRGADPGRAVADRVRAVAGDHDMLFRRGPDRLTVMVTQAGAPAEGRCLVLTGTGFDHTVVTDSSGTAVFRDLAEGDYQLDIEGVAS